MITDSSFRQEVDVDTTPGSHPSNQSDGRHRRAERMRQLILASAHTLVLGKTPLTAVVTAKKADVSVRSVFSHFKTAEGLAEALCEYVCNEASKGVVKMYPKGDLLHRLQWVMSELLPWHEKLAPLYDDWLCIDVMRNAKTAAHRLQKETLNGAIVCSFNDELILLESVAQRDKLRRNLYLVLHPEYWAHLRRHVDREEVERIVSRSIIDEIAAAQSMQH